MTAAAPVLRHVSRRDAVPSRECWDVICVGSGMGSLAAAAALARLGKSVLVLEAHSQLGGLTHTFQRKKVRWGTGLHYTGWPTAYFNDFPSLWHTLTGGTAPWARLPDETDHYLHPDGGFVKRAPRERYRDDLLTAFPDERPVVERYLDDMRRITADYLRFMTLQALPPWLERCGLGWWLGGRFLRKDRESLVAYMDRLGASERLRRHLWFTWGNFGGVPAETSVGAYAVPNEFMHDGLWTLAQGAQSAAAAFAQTIRSAGGGLRGSARVTGLVFDGGRVAGVRVGDEVLRARAVISGVGARETYELLVPPERRPRTAAAVCSMRPSCSIFTLYLALDPAVITHFGLTGVNYWVECVRGAMKDCWRDLAAPPPWFLLSLAPRFQHEEAALLPAEIFTGVPGEHFARWQGSRVMKRGPEYAELKARLADRVLDRVEERWPGFRACVRYAEGATPLTIESYTNHLQGAAYGIAPVPGRYSNRALRVLSGVPGLFLTGQDVSAAGVIGAFYGGMAAASGLLRTSVPRTLLRLG